MYSNAWIATGYGLDGPGSIPSGGQEIFLFTVVSVPSLGPTQPPIQWVPGALTLGVKRHGLETDHSPSSSVDVKNGEAMPSLYAVRSSERRKGFSYLRNFLML
jgi:hypothetical protein